jgi:hypothetical protein
MVRPWWTLISERSIFQWRPPKLISEKVIMLCILGWLKVVTIYDIQLYGKPRHVTAWVTNDVFSDFRISDDKLLHSYINPNPELEMPEGLLDVSWKVAGTSWGLRDTAMQQSILSVYVCAKLFPIIGWHFGIFSTMKLAVPCLSSITFLTAENYNL